MMENNATVYHLERQRALRWNELESETMKLNPATHITRVETLIAGIAAPASLNIVNTAPMLRSSIPTGKYQQGLNRVLALAKYAEKYPTPKTEVQIITP